MSATPYCFVIGPIGDAGSAIRRKADWVLHGLIKPVLEDEAFGYHVKRADQDPNPGSISDAMINDIFDAELVVADLTGFNPNAFYELGIRHAFQKPAIHIIAERGAKPPFDNQDQRTIEVDFEDFHQVEEARASLRAAVNYVRSSDFRVSNPVTRARGIAELIASGDPKDALLAQLQGDLAAMADRVRRLERPSRSSAGRNTPVDTDLTRRFGEYYSYIREAILQKMQVPFNRDVIHQAVISDDKESFVAWYAKHATSRRWLSEIKNLDSNSLDFLLGRERLIGVLSPTQVLRILDERNRRLNP